MNLQDARKKLPELAGLSDQSALNVIHEVYYPNMDKADLSRRLGIAAPEDPAPERSTMRAVGDLAAQFGGGVVSGVRMMSDMFGANNAVSGGLRSAEEALQSLQSAAAQQDQQKVAAIMQEAEGKGWGEQIALGLKAAMVAPGAMMAQSLGTAVPTLATALIPGVGPAAVAARMGAGAAVGAAQGAGNIKGVIYEDVKRELAKANPGMSPEEIEARAAQAQSFTGENAGQIALGGALGVAAGTTGMERALSGLRHGVTKAPAGVMARALAGGTAEALPEFAQGGQEKYASNVAQAGQGLDVDPWSGVIAQGTMEATAGFAPGAISGIPAPKVVTTPGQDVANTIRAENMVPESGPLGRAVNAGTEAQAQQAEAQIDAAVQNTRLTNTSMADMMAGQTDPLQGAMFQAATTANEPLTVAPEADPVVNESLTDDAPADDQSEQPLDMVPPGIDPATGEVIQSAPQPDPLDFTGKTDAELQQARQSAQSPAIRNAIAKELQARRAAAEPVEQPATNKPATLPTNLAGAKERYNYGKKGFDLAFDNDIDRAAYITALTKPDGKRSAKDAYYLKFAMDATGMSEADVRAHGQKVKDSIKAQAKGAEPGKLAVPKLFGADVTLMNEGKTAQKATKKDAKRLFDGQALADREKSTPPDANAFSAFQSAGKEAEFQELLSRRKADKASLTEDEENKFFDLRTERNRVLAATKNATAITPEAGKPAKSAPLQAPTVTRESKNQSSAGRPGYDTEIEVSANALQAAFERDSGEPLVSKPEKLEAWRNGTAKTNPVTSPIEVGFKANGKFGINDGRHRIALAAERGENVKVMVDGKDVESLNALQPVTQPATSGVPEAGAGTTQPPQAAPIKVRYGVDGTPIHKGGKPFKTRKAADLAKKHQSDKRIVTVDGGYVLADKTPAQIAANAKAAKRLGVAQTTEAGKPIAAHEFIAGAGGLSQDARADLGVEGNPRIGNRTLYAGKGKGLSIEQATMKLQEAGYLQGDDQNAAYDLIRRSLSDPQYTAEGTEQDAEAQMQARYDAHLAEMQDASDDLESLESSEFDLLDANIPFGDTASNMTEAEAMRLLGFTEQEIKDATTNQPRGEKAGSQSGEFADETQARGPENGDGQRAQAPQGNGQAEGLTSYTAADIEKRQEEQASTEAEQKRINLEAERKAQADSQVNDFVLTGSNRDADMAAARGQGGLFDTPAQPSLSQPKTETSAQPLQDAASVSQPEPKQEAKQAAKEEPKPASKTPIYDAHNDLIQRVVAGNATPEQFKASFELVVSNVDAIKDELTAKTKAELLREGGAWVQMRYGNENKADIVDAMYRSMVGDYALNQTVQYGMGKGAYEAAVRQFVEATDDQRLADFAKERAAAIEDIQAKRAAKAAALENPQTLDDYRTLMTAKMREGMTRKEAYLSLTAEQRVTFDELEAESTRETREASKRMNKTAVQSAGQTTGGEIIATKHTREGYDLFVVRLAERVSREDYGTLLSSAKKLGGWYSSFRGNGATPGFQFKDKPNAEAFLKLAAGDTADAQAQVAQRRDAFEDDRSQTAAERLTTMADKLEESADESLNADRKTNTERRARFANAAEAAARAEKAMAKTMRNIAQAITDGKAKFLDAVRTKTQVQMLTDIVRTAKDSELRSKYPTYADMEKRRGEPPTVETADFAEFPTFTAFRSDLAGLARQLLEVGGTKKLGQQLMNVADDVTDAYMDFAKANLGKVSQFMRGNDMAVFASRDMAEKAIRRSNLTGMAIVLPVKRGDNRIILSPSEAISRGVWQGDGDKRITLTKDAGQLLVQAIGRRANKQNRLTVPWQFESADTKLKALARMGIETPAEFRRAVREFIGLREQAQEADRVKMLERAMVGRKADGLDFFPTPQDAADAMVEAAEITPDMAVLEPSAGMGHLADRIRAAGAEPDVIEISAERRELLQEKGYNTQEVDDFLSLKPRQFYTFGDVFRAPDGKEGVMRGLGGMGSDRVRLQDEAGGVIGYYNRSELTGIRHGGTDSGYDRIIMNPPFSDRRDAAHVMHAYDLLKPGGRIVAIMGEGVFFGQDKKAEEFRAWFDERGGTSEKLAEGTFMDPSLPVTTGVNARMVVIDKPASAPVFSRSKSTQQAYEARIDALFAGEKANRKGAVLLDSSDIMGLLGYPSVPMVLNEAHLLGGLTVHPEMTSAQWKKVPLWLENPAAVYNDPKHPGRLTVIAPDLFAGYPVVIAVEPNPASAPQGHQGPVQLVVTAFAKTTGGLPPLGVLSSSGRLLYADKQKVPQVWQNIGDNPRALSPTSGTKKILTEKNLSGYRRAQDPAMSRGNGRGVDVATAQDVVDEIKAKWANAPEIVVVNDLQDPLVPESVRLADSKQKSLGASGEAEGFFDNGKVYIVASALRSPGAVMRVLFHESLGHFGLRGVFGSGLTPILQQLAGLRRQEIIAKAREYGLVRKGQDGKPSIDVDAASDAQVYAAMDADHKLTAAEEVLAEMAQSKPEMGYVKRAIAIIRGFLRKLGLKLQLTDDDIIGQYILPARAFVERGPGGGPKGGLSFSRSDDAGKSEFSETESRIGGVDAYIKAYQDGKTKLNYKQWVQVRTPSFKKWWGYDWESSGRDIEGTGNAGRLASGERPGNAGQTAGVGGYGNQGARSSAEDQEGPLAREFTFINDRTGEPRVLLHGTRDRFTVFDANHANKNDFGWLGRGHYFTSDESIADLYARKKKGDGPKRFMEVFVRPNNPLYMTFEEKVKNSTLTAEQNKAFTDAMKQKGHGGAAILFEDGTIELMTFDPAGIKSATDNNGDFNPANPDIRFSRSTVGATELAGQVRDKLNETFNHPGKLNWWHKTVGSQYNLAERNPAFKKVFDAAQDFINDVSYYATEAANMAPKILPKLETFKDLTKTAISAADNKAVAAPVFEGSLSWARDADGKPIRIEALEKRYENLTDDQKAQMLLRKNVVSEAQLKAWKASKLDVYQGAIRNRFESEFLKPGVRWTDAELKSIFKLTDDQVGLYQEFRAATDASLDNMAKAQMLREAGKDVADMRDAVMEAPDVDTAAQMLREVLLDMAKDNPDRADVLTDAAAGVLDTAAKINGLKKQGYAPLSRFGRFTVDVVVDGKREYFGLFESEAESNRMAAKMRMEFGAANVAQGTMSQKEFELFQGITPESLELFGNMMGLDSTGDEAQDKAFQTYLKLTKNNRSAMKRLIHRQGIAGYSEDVGRVLAAFVYANARQTSAALHIGQMDEAITAIPKGDGELKDHALELAKYIKEPREEAAAMRGLLFAQYLGGSVASALVNFTQPLTVSVPYLSQFGGLAKAGKAWAQAVSDMRKGAKLEPGLERALKDAEESGVVSPQEVHQLMAQARGAATLQSGDGTKLGDAKAKLANGWTRTALAWGKLFGYAEQVNRRSTFIAAYRMAVDQKIPNPGKFAEKAVNETQFVNNKANKMKFGRGAIGATLMTFKSYSINWLELMHRLSTQDGKEGKLAAAYMLGALFLVAGAGGLPFAGDAEDLIDAIAQKMGYNFSTKKAKQEFLEDLFGKAGAQFIDRGLTGLPGVPIDVSGRMGMSNLIPGTGLMLEKRDSSRDLMELAGPAGDMTKRMFEAVGMLAKGEFGSAIESAAPKAVGNMLKGADMLDKGMYRDTKGAKVIDTTMGEAVAKMAGFQPASVSQVQESNFINQRAKDFYNLKTQEIRAKWAMGIFENDPDKVDEARKMMQEWNKENPDQRMNANMPAIVKKVREMRKDKAQRIADTAPKAMRAQMQADARESVVN
jgi:ADP-Ribosyltransferase in polyvalent proteins/Phage MuF-C-terminal domain